MKLSATNPRCLRDQFPSTASDDALDLLSKMLEFSPDTRISVEDALRHPFMQNLHVRHMLSLSSPSSTLLLLLLLLLLLFVVVVVMAFSRRQQQMRLFFRLRRSPKKRTISNVPVSPERSQSIMLG